MDPRHIYVQSMQHGLELELNGAINHLDEASKAASENNRMLKGVQEWLDRRAEMQRAAAELDRRRREGHIQVHIQWKSRFAELEKEMQEKQAALEQEFHERIDQLEEWRRGEDSTVEREWSQRRAALESSPLLSASLQQGPAVDPPQIKVQQAEPAGTSATQ